MRSRRLVVQASRTRWIIRCVAVTALLAQLACRSGAPGGTSRAGSGPAEPGHPSGVAPDLGSGPAEARAALASCPEGAWPAGGSGEAVHLGTHDGVSVLQSAGAPPVVVAVGRIVPEASAGCTLLQPLESVAPVAGRFWPLGGLVQAVLLTQQECSHDVCPDAVLVRDGERSLAALFLPETCVSYATERLSWFTGQDSLRLTCRQSAGASQREIVYVLHVGASGLVPVFALETGTAEAATQEERETPGFCERRPVGWVRLVEKGERPVIRALDPARGPARGQPGDDGKGTGLLADFRFDPGTGRFEQIGPGKQESYDARAWCKK
jgi:hypothetical protein